MDNILTEILEEVENKLKNINIRVSFLKSDMLHLEDHKKQDILIGDLVQVQWRQLQLKRELVILINYLRNLDVE